MFGPFSEAKLREIAETVIEQQDALDHEEATGKMALFVHHTVKQLHNLQLVEGRGGEYFKFTFEYEVEVIEEEFPDEPYRARYSRSIRINSQGGISAIGGRQLLEEYD
jgi:hypothetical protein